MEDIIASKFINGINVPQLKHLCHKLNLNYTKVHTKIINYQVKHYKHTIILKSTKKDYQG